MATPASQLEHTLTSDVPAESVTPPAHKPDASKPPGAPLRPTKRAFDAGAKEDDRRVKHGRTTAPSTDLVLICMIHELGFFSATEVTVNSRAAHELAVNNHTLVFCESVPYVEDGGPEDVFIKEYKAWCRGERVEGWPKEDLSMMKNQMENLTGWKCLGRKGQESRLTVIVQD
jgi:hypothetical protein